MSEHNPCDDCSAGRDSEWNPCKNCIHNTANEPDGDVYEERKLENDADN